MPYHLIICYSTDAFKNGQFEMAAGRCLEYTDNSISEHFYRFGETRLDELLALPALLAYEEMSSTVPVRLVKFTEITRRGNIIRTKYEDSGTTLSYSKFKELAFELDVDGFELSRTHWAIKNLSLTDVLAGQGISVPTSAFPPRPYVDLESHKFKVALSFPGEDRGLVQDIASRLEQRLGPNSVFYDFHYQAYLARPSLDTLLQSIYKNAHLNVVFLSENYEKKRWCSGIEFRAIREIIAQRENDRVMFIRTGEGDVQGVFDTDGWINSDEHLPDDIAFFVEQRARVYEKKV